MSRRILAYCIFICFMLLWTAPVISQTIQPIIVEYKQKGEGKFEITNNTLSPMVVVLEPKSFGITPKGMGIYRPLDPTIHVELSSMSVRLQPLQSYYIFYKAHADVLPAWFTIYAIFSPARSRPGLNIRIMLPHTVYLYQKKPLLKSAVDIKKAIYIPAKNIVVCDIENQSNALGRMREGSIVAGRESEPIGGGPLLPHSPRQFEIAWTGKRPPEFLIFHFNHFKVKEPISKSN